VFGGFKARREAARAAEVAAKEHAAFEAELHDWQVERDGLASMIEFAQSDGAVPDGLVVHLGELAYGTLTNCSLIEERKGAGHFVAGSAGVSIPIGSLGGRSIRYRVGSTRGHYVQGTPAPTAIANGTLYLTNQRIVFISPTQTRECRFDRLVGMNRDDESGQLMLSVSNRQHPIVLSYGSAVGPWMAFHVDLAMAQWRGDVDQLVAQLAAQLAAHDAVRPRAIDDAPTETSSAAVRTTTPAPVAMTSDP